MARLLHLVASNQRRGAETFASELAEHLRGAGHEVDLLAVEPAASGPYLDVEVAGSGRTDPRGVLRTVRAVRAHDLTISFGSSSLQAAALAATIARRPFVYRNIGDPAEWQSVRASGVRVGLPLRLAAAVVAVFPAAGDELVRRYGLRPERVRPIPRGVPAARFPVVDEARRRAARAALHLDPDRPWAIYVGSLSEEKCPLDAVAAVAGHPTMGLVMCGDGPMRSAVETQGLLPPERFRCMGPVPDVRDAIAASDVLVLTSRTEGVPGVAIEAGLSGLPVVAPRVGGIPFAVHDGETGLLVDRGDVAGTTAALADTLARRDELGAAAAAWCRERFSMEQVGAAWADLVREVLGR